MRLKGRDLGVWLGDRWVFRGLTFEADEGSILAVLGPSGAGKTTLLGVIAGFIAPTEGQVVLEGMSDQGLVAWSLQEAPLLLRRTVLANAAAGALCCGVGKQAAEVAAHESLRLVGIGHLEGRLCGTLSGGERQRVSVARSLASCAELLLADEPTASLDAASRGDVCRGLLAAARGGVTVVVATHDPFVADQASRTVSLGSEAEGANGPR